MTDKSDMKLEEILQSASDRLFPADTGDAKVYLDSRSSLGDNALHVFIWGNETEKALLLIENGIDINAVGENGETPLHAAFHQNNRTVIEALLKANARTDIVSEYGQTAKDLAKAKGVLK
ncbi:MAG: ankyrin repeat domain-containing protein [Candidatus Delongbacteria bacterium]|nr:ankyrin repeat domain-containing protein [Candidatus Delongbacteria bacterium]